MREIKSFMTAYRRQAARRFRRDCLGCLCPRSGVLWHVCVSSSSSLFCQLRPPKTCQHAWKKGRVRHVVSGGAQVRAFVRNVEGTGKQELNQSPLPFIESASQPGSQNWPVLLCWARGQWTG